ncbi:putative hydrolase of the HAD superfamily [Jannaschia faecimaris]|uniref:Putative hydrolase of the HAD superfamily n=1 Tax=Jannaschia faecimaris TaxID=1244108 RepID=A0A1H3QBK7_9RHOB|nr:HAD-IA family hydrolase [Jannaschia faecimaris]SDZ10944.1 putative hydrolase of the HAD superfamily [Jannaschia faecimaris]
MIVANVPLRAVLWDFDGVLNDNAPRGRFLWSDGFEEQFGQPLDGFVDTVFGSLGAVLTGKEDLFDRINRWIDGTGANTTPEAVAQHWLDHDFHPNARLLPSIERMSNQGYTQAILTNADARRADWIEGLLPRLPGIDRVFASARIGHAKPDAQAFQAVLDALEMEAGEVMFIDDSSDNVNAAASLGFRTFRYSTLANDALLWNLPR